MVIARVIVSIKEEHRAAFLEHMRKETAELRTFKGCLRFDILVDPVTEGTYVLYEEWATEEDFEAYKKSEQFANNGKVIYPMVASKPDAKYFKGEPLN